MKRRLVVSAIVVTVVVTAWTAWTTRAAAQIGRAEIGVEVPPDVRQMYERGLAYLANSQLEDGSWGADGGSRAGTGVTALGLMALLGSGEDCNYGRYCDNIRAALRNIIRAQNAETGYLTEVAHESMYHHGFAMLALAECHGLIDERLLWKDQPEGAPRTIGKALELAVRCSLTSQDKNPWNAWRYSPDSPDADTSVSGAVMMGLLAARNAGVEVPDVNIDKAVAYYVSVTSGDGQVAYSTQLGYDENWARPAIACLVYATAKRTDVPQYKATIEYLKSHIDEDPTTHRDYTRYYTAQALFKSDPDAWRYWNNQLVAKLKQSQNPDGSFPSAEAGVPCGTSLTLLAMAVNFKLLPIYER
jgi:hypothetical protein